MKVLLVYPQYVYHESFDARTPSLSLLYLAASLEKDGRQVEIFDASDGPIEQLAGGYLYGVANDNIKSFFDNKSYDLVGITCSYASRWPFVSELASLFKGMWPETPVVTGGIFPTYEWKFCFDNSRNIDAIVLGEGEETLANIVNSLETAGSLQEACSSIDGVAWRTGDNIKRPGPQPNGLPPGKPKKTCSKNKVLLCNSIKMNQKTGHIKNLDDLPFPAWHLINLDRFFKQQKNFYELRPPYLTVLSSRGCPEACSFCNMFVAQGRKWRFRSPENFVDELEYFKEKYQVNSFFIADDNFSLKPERAKDICREILKRKLDIKYNTGNGLCINRIDKELLQLMKESGCGSIALGIESGSEKIRNEVYKKRLPTEKIYQAVKWCKEIGLPSVGFFMVGAPGENRETVEETKSLIKNLPLTLCTCSIYTPYPGTALYNECVEKGYVKPFNPQDYKRMEFATGTLTTPDFSASDIVEWQKEIYLFFIKMKWQGLLWQLIKPNGVITFFQLSKIKRLLNFNNFLMKFKGVSSGAGS